MSRVRLTSRKAADMSIPYPGNVNQPNRKDPSWDEYHTFEQRVNHELPDMRHDWQNDDRDEVGFGVSEPWGESPKVPGALPPPPTVASVRMAATKAVRIAVLLLGEKVEDEVIEEQARDMMSMSGSAMDRTLARFADTQKLYAEDKAEEDKKAEDKDEEKKAALEDKFKTDVETPGSDEQPKVAEDKKDEEKKSAKKDDEKDAADKDDDKKAEDKDEEKKAAKKDDDKKAEDKKDEPPAFIQKKIEESKKGSKSLAEKKAEDKKDDEKKAAKKDEDDKKATDDADADDKKAEDKDEADEKKASPNELGIELGAADEEEEEMDEKTAAQLQSLFEDRSATAAEELDEEVKLSKKAGIKKLGGQPRVASADSAGATDISNIWQSAPDVSDVFK